MAELSRAPLPTLASKAFGRTVGQVTARWRAVPDYLVIGTKRGGTTSLQQYLTAHPDVLEPMAAKASHYFDVNHDKGWSWYRAHFPLQSWMDRQRAAGRRVVVGEASPYYCFHPLALDRIAAQLPTVRPTAFETSVGNGARESSAISRSLAPQIRTRAAAAAGRC